jgi:predicted MFS family arabinose efflux permease
VLEAGVIASALLVAFVVHQRRTAAPLLDVRLFRNPRFTAASATIMLTFFALIGFVFLATQYLQFVLGFTPLQAGLRTLPYAAAMIVAAPLSAKVVERLGTKRVVVFGMVLFSVGLLEASTATVTSGYTPVAIAMVLMGIGTGLVMAPATDSIMGSLPPEHAGVGSAMNDTTREIGAALGVAVIGSVMSSFYGPRVLHDVPAALPAQARDAIGDSVGAASTVAAQMGSAGNALLESAREAFVYAMQRASWVAAAVGLLGALLAWKWLPARAEETLDDELTALVLPEVELAPAYGPIERCSDHPDCVDALDGAGVR